MNPYASIHLVLLLVALTAPADPPAPVIIVAPGGKQPAPQPTPIPPAPIPTSVKLSGAEFEILTLIGHSGPVTWDVTSPDFAVPVKLIELKPKESVVGIRAGSVVPDRHEAPDTPSVAVWAVNSGTATVAAWGVKDSRPVKLATFRVEAGQGPRPPPKPDPIDGALGLIKASREGLAKVAVSTKAADAVKLAKAQRGIASAIAAGGVSQPAAILAAWRDANRATVDGAAWKPWGEVVSAALSKLYADGKLPDKSAWVAAFTEIADGLEGK